MESDQQLIRSMAEKQAVRQAVGSSSASLFKAIPHFK